MEDNKVIKELIQEKKYSEAIKMIKDKIIEYVVDLIRKKDSSYEYTNVIDLIQMSNHYIEDERKNIARNLEYFSIEEDKVVVLARLLEICEIYNIR